MKEGKGISCLFLIMNKEALRLLSVSYLRNSRTAKSCIGGLVLSFPLENALEDSEMGKTRVLNLFCPAVLTA